MPADASIFAALRPQVQMQDPLEQYGRMISIKSMIGNDQLNEMQRTKLGRDMQQEENFRQLFADASPDQVSAPDFMRRAMAADPQRAMVMQKSMLDQQKAQAELFKTKLETGAKALELHRDQLVSVNDPQAAAAWVKSAYDDPTLKPLAAHGGTLEQALSRIPTDPAAFAEWKRNSGVGMSKLLEMNQQLAAQKETARHHAATEAQAGATLAESKRYHDAMIGTPPNSNDPDFEKQVDYWATVVRKGGALPPGLARGPGGGAFVREVTKRAAVGDVPPEDMMANQARFAGEKAGQRTLGTRTANIEMAATEAASLAQLAKEASAKVDRTNYKALNDIFQAGQKATSSPELRDFTAANTSFINAYARAINPQGVGTVADKEHAREMLSTAFSKADYDSVINQLQKEIDAARKSPGTVQKEMRDRFTGKEQPQGAAEPGKSASGGIKFLGWEK